MVSTQPTLALFLRFDGLAVVVAGGGHVASRRVEQLLAVGARITVISPDASASIRAHAAAGRLVWLERAVSPADASGARLVIAATDDSAANAGLADTADAAGVWAVREDDAAAASAVVPAVVDRSPLRIAVASDGRAPTLSRRLAARLAAWVPPAYGDLARLADASRDRVAARLSQSARRRFWTDVFEGSVAEAVFAGRMDAARARLDAALAAADASGRAPAAGEVALIGVGPGDPDLLTLRALRLMQRADVVAYDALVPAAIVDLAAPDAERVHVGKRADRHTLAQDQINRLLIERAARGARVARLKGGDPFVFGRGGEEIEALAAAGAAFQVVPGITAASGCAAYAGIPLTHRDYAQSVVFVAGHRQRCDLELSWPELARPGQTLVFYMAGRNLAAICRALRAHGLPADWPVALVVNATTAHQQVHVASLEPWSEPEKTPAPDGPALAIVGEVVKLHATLDWFRAPRDLEASRARPTPRP